MIDPDAALTFLNFVEERHRVWELRQAGRPGPWTEDPILARQKFTNAFRILDPGTQFLMTDLFEPELSQRDTLLRAFLYRHTGNIDAWRHVRAQLGEYPHSLNLDAVRACWQEYRAEGGKVFTGAYLVYPQSSTPGTNKADSILDLTDALFNELSLTEITYDFLDSRNDQAERFAVLRRNKGVADFMSMQVLTDWGYSRFGEDSEDEFVVCGPGARRGAQAIDPAVRPEDTLRWVAEAVHNSEACPELPLDSYGGNYRRPSLMDLQNCLCEFSKYVRYAAKEPTKTKLYKPANPGEQPAPVLPSHWF